jgi:hypothetical protein
MLQSARSSGKRKMISDEEEDVPLSARKKSNKTSTPKVKNKRKKTEDDFSDIEEVYFINNFISIYFSNSLFQNAFLY